MISPDEREFYQKEARRLGYQNFTSFAKTAMLKLIETADPLAEALNSIVETCNDTERWLQEIEEPAPREAEALEIIRAIEQLAIRTKVMQEDPHNMITVSGAMLDPDEEPHERYRFALVKDDLVDAIYKRIEKAGQ